MFNTLTNCAIILTAYIYYSVYIYIILYAWWKKLFGVPASTRISEKRETCRAYSIILEIVIDLL